MPPSYTFEEALDKAIRSILSDVWTALPGVVVAFDPLTCTCDVQPAIRRIVPVDDDEDTTEDLAILPDLPVVYPQSAAGAIRFPLAAGDPVLVVCSAYSATKWRLTGEAPSDPQDTRQHHLAHSVVIPGWVPDCNVTPLTVPDGIEITAPSGPVVMTGATVRVLASAVRVQSSDVRLGIDDDSDTHDKFVALAPNVSAELTALKNAVAAAVAPAGGGPLTGLTYTPGNVAATRVKAR